MPVWYEGTKKWVKEGKLVILGITQEQHPERCQLFAQWKNFDFPIVQDPFTALGSWVVPIVIAIDEHGIVRSTRPRLATFEKDFLNRKFQDDATAKAVADPTPPLSEKTDKPDFAQLKTIAQKQKTAQAWTMLGDALYLWGGDARLNDAITSYELALKTDPDNGPTLFRLGVCYRRRHEMATRQATDFQTAIEHWGRALESNPNQYIWRRRIQQYGPRLDKPYPFYDWVSTARKEILARGDKPIELRAPLVGAEIAHPSRRFDVNNQVVKNPDPQGKIIRDKGLVKTEVTVVPNRVRAGSSARIHIEFYPNAAKKAHWNNEGEPLRLWVDVPKGWKVSQSLHSAPQPKKATSKEKRSLDFEIQVPGDAKQGKHELKAFALYFVCEVVDGTCLFLRQDVSVIVEVR